MVGVCVCGVFFLYGVAVRHVCHTKLPAALQPVRLRARKQHRRDRHAIPHPTVSLSLPCDHALPFKKKIPSQCKKGGMEPTTFRFRMKPFSNKSPPRHLNSFHTFPEKNTATTYRQKHLIQSFSLTRAPPLAHRAHRLRSRRARL